MDKLHTMLRTISGETKSDQRHLTVFREFLSHLDQIQRKAPVKPVRTRTKPPTRRKPSKRVK